MAYTSKEIEISDGELDLAEVLPGDVATAQMSEDWRDISHESNYDFG